MVPGTFEVCWQCLSDKAGQQPANAQQLLSEVDGDGHETEAPVEVEESPAPPEILKPEADVEPPKPEAVVEEDEEELAGKCPRCGSTRLIPDVTERPTPLFAESADILNCESSIQGSFTSTTRSLVGWTAPSTPESSRPSIVGLAEC
jgi:hypothetical protein